MMVPCEGPIGMPLQGANGLCSEAVPITSQVMVLQQCKLTGRTQKARLLASVVLMENSYKTRIFR